MKKLYYSIGEVSRITRLEPYVLRFWETQFDELSPRKTSGNARKYQEADIELIQRIRYLLYEEEYTIPGARKKLKSDRKDPQQILREIRAEIVDLLEMLK